MAKLKYRQCPYCKRIVPTSYDFAEHKMICKNVPSGCVGNINN